MAILINKEGKGLEERLNELIARSDELKFLVGFFYFSGFREIYESIKKNTDLKEIKVLVGLDVDEYNDLLIEFGKDYKNNEYKENKKSDSEIDEEIKANFLNSYRKIFKAEECDTKEFFEQVKLF